MPSQRPNGLWEARKRATRPDGTKIRQSFYASTPEEADALAEAWALRMTGKSEDPGLFADYVTSHYVPTIKHLSFDFREHILWALKTQILPVFGAEVMANVTRQQVQAFLNRKGDNLTPRAAAQVRKVLGEVLTLAEKDGFLAKNPMRGTKMGSVKAPPQTPFTTAECADLFKAAEGEPIQGPILLGAFLGLRLGECLGLHRSDIDANEVRIKRQVHKQERQIKIEEAKPDSSNRTIPLPPGFFSLFVARTSTLGDFACPNPAGEVQNPENAGRLLERTCKKAGLPTCTFNHLRASFSANLNALGCPPRIRKELMGHSDEDVSVGFEDEKRKFLSQLFEAVESSEMIGL